MRTAVSFVVLISLAPVGCKRSKPAPFPPEVAGFRFGMSTAEFRAKCASSGKPSSIDMQRLGLRVLACDAVEVQPGWHWSVFGAFCGSGSLCEISYLSSNELAAHDFDILSQRLRKDFGRRGEVKSSLGEGPAERACAQEGGIAGLTWEWGAAGEPDGRIRLVLDCKSKPAMLSMVASDGQAIATKRDYARQHPAHGNGAGASATVEPAEE